VEVRRVRASPAKRLFSINELRRRLIRRCDLKSYSVFEHNQTREVLLSILSRDKLSFAEISVKQIDLAAWQMTEQHRRLQQEIYVRLQARVNISNYILIVTGGFFSTIGFFMTRPAYPHIRDFMINANAHDMGLIAIITLAFGITFTLLLLGFVNHSGNIYAASQFIETEIARFSQKIEQNLLAAFQALDLPAPSPLNSHEIYSWETHLSQARSRYRITSSNLEGVAAAVMSGFLFVMFIALSIWTVIIVLHEPPSLDYIKDRMLPLLFFLFFLLGAFLYTLLLWKVGRSYRYMNRFHRQLGKRADMNAIQGA
jgi:ABC-type multidrug transport system fused ATPase/permease subunit